MYIMQMYNCLHIWYFSSYSERENFIWQSKNSKRKHVYIIGEMFTRSAGTYSFIDSRPRDIYAKELDQSRHFVAFSSFF